MTRLSKKPWLVMGLAVLSGGTVGRANTGLIIGTLFENTTAVANATVANQPGVTPDTQFFAGASNDRAPGNATRGGLRDPFGRSARSADGNPAVE
jgi:hypothetical protein